MLKKILLIVTIIMLNSCATQKRCTQKYPLPQTKESIKVVQQILRDTVIQISADSSAIQALIECDSAGNAYLKQILQYQNGSKLMPPAISVKENVFTVKANMPKQNVTATMKDVYTTDTLIIHTNTTVTTNKLTWWQVSQLYALRFLLVIITAYYLLRKTGIIN